jgi:hypothetical protein
LMQSNPTLTLGIGGIIDHWDPLIEGGFELLKNLCLDIGPGSLNRLIPIELLPDPVGGDDGSS